MFRICGNDAPIEALLTLAATAIIAGARSVNAIADFGRDRTSLSRRRAKEEKLLKIARDHGSIENGIHRVRDVTMGEDTCTGVNSR